ncbi:efflux RND transporter periplasmic adaptor subunit [Acetobacter oeni]|nr:efflux RND transporter periplasmic adaptor subunit [Acetobacter oeni]MBB3883617.1 cobalt-zinc-cadmium efflux system membrane fusion protein [Acetobacter oeni]
MADDSRTLMSLHVAFSVFRALCRPAVAVLPVLIGLAFAGAGHSARGADSAPAPVPDVQHRPNGLLAVEPGSPVDKRLVVGPVSMSRWDRGTTSPGTIVAEPSRNVTVLPPSAGRIIDMTVKIGDHVQVGDELAHILSADVAQATADEIRARADLDLARRTFKRNQGVLSAGGGTAKDLDSARAALTEAEAEEDRAQTKLDALSASTTDSGVMTLKSPIEGDVSIVNATAGVNITDITQPLVVVTSIDEVWAVADVPERDIAGLALGQPVNLTMPAFPGKIFHSTVSGITPIMQPDSQVLDVRVILPNLDGKLHPNMYASMTVMEPEPPTLSVPQSALLMNNDAVTVFVEVRPHTFERRSVRIIYDDGDNCRVLSGLSAGERIVTSGAILLNDD